jgi:acyl-CoA synthetase (AMP-forming)/AMP-acid ligase II
MNLLEILTKNSQMYPNSSAFVEIKPVTRVRREIRWREFDERVNKLANSLEDAKMVKGKRILLMGRNSIN